LIQHMAAAPLTLRGKISLLIAITWQQPAGGVRRVWNADS